MNLLSTPTSSTGKRWFARLTSLGCLGAVAIAAGRAPAPAGEDPSVSASHALAGSGEIKDFTGLCVDVQWGATDSGTPIQLWDCNGSDAQQWSYQNGAMVGLGGKCLDVQGAQTANGTPVQLRDCNGTDAQQWSIQGQQLVGVGGKCLDVPGWSSFPGQTLQIWDCHGGDNQHFPFNGATSSGSGGGGAGGADPGGTTSSGGSTGSGPVTPPSGDLAAAQEFVRPLTLGMNIERGWAWSMPGVDSAGSTEYWSYLKNTVGATHVRLFYPWRPSVNMGGGGPNNIPPSEEQFGRILDASQQAINAGLKVFLDCTDVMGIEDFTGSNGDQTEAEINSCASWVAARNFDPNMLALGPVNEWAGGDDNTTFNDHPMETPSIWAVTYGSSYRLNKAGDDSHLMDGSNGQPNLVQMYLDNEAAMRSVKGL